MVLPTVLAAVVDARGRLPAPAARVAADIGGLAAGPARLGRGVADAGADHTTACVLPRVLGGRAAAGRGPRAPPCIPQARGGRPGRGRVRGAVRRFFTRCSACFLRVHIWCCNDEVTSSQDVTQDVRRVP
jgi:hypothetical protein